jgi:hypothetical protein
MTLTHFGRNIIGRLLVIEQTHCGWRCYFPNVMYTEKQGAGIAVTVIGAGPNQQRMLEDFVQKVRGKWARIYDGLGAYTEYPVPPTLTV